MHGLRRSRRRFARRISPVRGMLGLLTVVLAVYPITPAFSKPKPPATVPASAPAAVVGR
jgi:hypothetical protein